MSLCYELEGLIQKEIGEVFGVDYSTVSVNCKRLRGRVEEYEGGRKALEAIRNRSLKSPGIKMWPLSILSASPFSHFFIKTFVFFPFPLWTSLSKMSKLDTTFIPASAMGMRTLPRSTGKPNAVPPFAAYSM